MLEVLIPSTQKCMLFLFLFFSKLIRKSKMIVLFIKKQILKLALKILFSNSFVFEIIITDELFNF